MFSFVFGRDKTKPLKASGLPESKPYFVLAAPEFKPRVLATAANLPYWTTTAVLTCCSLTQVGLKYIGV
jgi:hypothetical protein